MLTMKMKMFLERVKNWLDLERKEPDLKEKKQIEELGRLRSRLVRMSFSGSLF